MYFHTKYDINRVYKGRLRGFTPLWTHPALVRMEKQKTNSGEKAHSAAVPAQEASAFSGVGTQADTGISLKQAEGTGVPGVLVQAGSTGKIFDGLGQGGESDRKPPETHLKKDKSGIMLRSPSEIQDAKERFWSDPFIDDYRQRSRWTAGPDSWRWRAMDVAVGNAAQAQDVVRSLSPSLRTAQKTKNALSFALLADIIDEARYTRLETYLYPNWDGKTKEARPNYEQLGSFHTQRVSPDDTYQSDALRTVQTFTEALLEEPDRDIAGLFHTACASDHPYDTAARMEILTTALGATDPTINPITLRNTGEGYADIHIQKVSTDPAVQARKTWEGLHKVRSLYPGISNNIRGISWLLQPRTERLLARMGLSGENGVQCHYVEPARLFEGSLYRPDALQFATPVDILKVAAKNIQFSPENISSFLREGTLPNIGVMVAPNKVFFRRGY